MSLEHVTRVLVGLRHGGHAGPGTAPGDMALPLEGASTPFGYLFGGLRAGYPDGHLPVEPASAVVAGLKALGSAMVDAPPDGEPNSAIPPVYTYWGQFVDHDITANTDREPAIGITTDPLTPVEPDLVAGVLRNLREPALNLDSVYGNGPGAPDVDTEVPYDGIAFRIGALTPGPPDAVPGHDLPRSTATGTARIADSRNDENLVVAQLHLAFLKFHNNVLDWLAANEPGTGHDQARFARARQLTRWHYQAILVHDFLRTIALPHVVDEALAAASDPAAGNPVVGADGRVFMPLEHAVAAYRFGHSMVRASYDWNENFGRRPDGTEHDPPQRASFEQLFLFTGNGIIEVPGGLPTLPSNWPIRWARFTDPGSPLRDRFARRIDTRLAPPLTDLSNEGKDDNGEDVPDIRIRRILKRLAVRNLLRGYRLALPTGQAVAAALGVPPLTAAELVSGDRGVADALVDGGFVDATPLWFYVLKEAEVRQDGQRLGEVGSRIVCTTLIGQLEADPTAYLNRPGGVWSPAEGVRLADGGQVATIRAFLDFAGVLLDRADLMVADVSRRG